MSEDLKLFMVLLGSKPPGRHTEQHDVFFSIANSLKELVPQIKAFWPDAEKLHIDGWREVHWVDEFKIEVKRKSEATGINPNQQLKIFFINLGGYKRDEFEEFHYKMLAVGENSGVAIQKSKTTAFYKHTGFDSANSHVDDKYGIDVDDVYFIDDVLPVSIKENYSIIITPSTSPGVDQIKLGYFKLDKILASE